jgi:hypothetical protein
VNLEFVNRASLTTEHENIGLIFDPWTECTAFYHFDKMVFYTQIANSINHDHNLTKPQYIKLAFSKILRAIGLPSKIKPAT